MRVLIIALSLVFAVNAIADELLPVRIGAKYGYVNTKGEIKIQPKFEAAFRFKDGLALVTVPFPGTGGRTDPNPSSKSGFIKEDGEYAIEPVFDFAYEFSGPVAGFGKRTPYKVGEQTYYDLKFGFIDRTGKVVFEPTLESVGYMSEGLVTATYILEVDTKKVRKTGYLAYDSGTGSMSLKITAKYDWALRFTSNGKVPVAVVGVSAGGGRYEKYFIDRDGTRVSPRSYNDLSSFSEGLAAYRDEDRGKLGFIDADYNVVVPPTYDGPMHTDFSEGMAAVGKFVGMIDGGDGSGKIPWYRYGYIRYDASTNSVKEVTEFKFEKYSKFSNGLAAVHTKWNARDSYYIDINGTPQFKGGLGGARKFKCASNFENGFASFCKDNSSYPSTGYIDRNGKVIFEPRDR